MTGCRQVSKADWVPGPYHQIAVLGTTMAELCAKHGVEPERVQEDGLGWVQYVGLELEDGTRFLLDWGELAPSTNITVSADVRDPAYGAAMKKLLLALGLVLSVVVFQHEDGSYDDLLQRQRQGGSDL